MPCLCCWSALTVLVHTLRVWGKAPRSYTVYGSVYVQVHESVLRCCWEFGFTSGAMWAGRVTVQSLWRYAFLWSFRRYEIIRVLTLWISSFALLRFISNLPFPSSATLRTQLHLIWISGSYRYTILLRTYMVFYEATWAKPSKGNFRLQGRCSVTTERDGLT